MRLWFPPSPRVSNGLYYLVRNTKTSKNLQTKKHRLYKS